MTATQPSGRTRFLAGSLLWGLWLVSASPVFSLFIEFKGRQLGDCGAEWWYYARFYSHFFLYPITFGLISTILLHRPWIQSVHYLCCLPKRPRIRKAGTIVFSILLVVGFLTYVEFYSEPPSGAVKSCDNIDNTRKFGGYTPQFWFFTPADMKEEVRDLLATRCKNATASLSDPDKCKLREELRNLWMDRDRSSPLSVTKTFYHAGFIAMTTLFGLLFATASIVTSWNPENMKDSAGEGSRESQRMAILLTHAFLFAMFWVLMWTAFLAEQRSTYPEAPLLKYNFLIWLVFVVVYACLIINRWSKTGHRARYHERILNVVGVALGIAGVALGVIGLFSPEWILDTLVHTFGTRGPSWTYLAVFLFLLAIHFSHILRLLGDDPEPDGPERPGTP